MSSGRSSIINCGMLGSIEFVHTKKRPQDLVNYLKYDSSCRLWRANKDLALKDLKATGRNLDLIDWELVYDTL